MSSLAARRMDAAEMPAHAGLPASITGIDAGRRGGARTAAWTQVTERHVKAPGRIVVCGTGPMIAHWIATAPRGVRVENAGEGDAAVAMVDMLLGRDRHGEISAVLVALDGEAAVAASVLRNLRAVIERSFHDAALLADWSGAEDDANFTAADAVVADASDWLPGRGGTVIRDRRLAS